MEQKFSEVFDINPKLKLNRNQKTDFVEMKNIESGKRGVVSEYKKEFKGSGSKFERGDTLFARITPCLENGKISRYDGPGTAFGSTEFIVIRGKEGVTLSNFAYYYSTWEKFREFCIQNMIGSSGRQRVPVDALDNWTVSLPSLPEQKKIADLLDSFDSKIELNQKMNETLEEIAKTLFKSWFIDFDPVRAKAEGGPTGLSKEISDLFPDSFEDSELGEIPKGWKIELFQDVVDEYVDNRGKTPPLVDIGIPLVEVKHMHDNSQFPDLNTDKYVSKDIFDSWFRKHVEKYDVLISTVGTIGLTTCVFNSNFAIAQNVLGLRFSTKSMSLYMFNLIKSNYFQHQMNSRLVETVQKSIKRKDLNEIPTLVPSEKILIEFFNFASANLEKQFNNKLQNATLSNLRDMLLPKLISGQLTIPEADNIIKKESV
jgi:type I restriction enzyme, S subunit